MSEQDRWNQEYGKTLEVPSSGADRPSGALSKFLETYEGPYDFAIDLGSGNGRNSVALAGAGFKKILGRELSDVAVDIANKKIPDKKLQDIITFEVGSITDPFEIEDNSVDLVVDMMVLHLVTEEERQQVVKEIYRILKPGGIYLLFTLGVNEYEEKLLKENPGPEKDTYTFKTKNGFKVVERVLREEELSQLFAPLTLKESSQITIETTAFGSTYTRAYLTAVFQK